MHDDLPFGRFVVRLAAGLHRIVLEVRCFLARNQRFGTTCLSHLQGERFGTTCLSHLQGQRFGTSCLSHLQGIVHLETLKMGHTSSLYTLVSYKKPTPGKTPKHFIQHYDRGGSLQLQEKSYLNKQLQLASIQYSQCYSVVTLLECCQSVVCYCFNSGVWGRAGLNCDLPTAVAMYLTNIVIGVELEAPVRPASDAQQHGAHNSKYSSV